MNQASTAQRNQAHPGPELPIHSEPGPHLPTSQYPPLTLSPIHTCPSCGGSQRIGPMLGGPPYIPCPLCNRPEPAEAFGKYAARRIKEFMHTADARTALRGHLDAALDALGPEPGLLSLRAKLDRTGRLESKRACALAKYAGYESLLDFTATAVAKGWM